MKFQSGQHETHSSGQRYKLLSRLLGSLTPILILALLGVNGHAFAKSESSSTETSLYGQYCSNTSVAARTACKHESQDDYVIAWAGCLNTQDSDDRSECFAEIREERKEARAECSWLFASRENVCDLIGQDRYDPQYEPEDFVDPGSIGYGDGDVAPNPYFPLVVGTKWVYEAEDEIIFVEVMEETMEVDGVNCVVVRDIVYETGSDEGEERAKSSVEADDDLPGVPVEDTVDWYAQDKDGNVWYFGEISLNFEDGVITDIDGSWKTGEEGARPGIVMPAAPMVGDVYRQEWLLGDAEDMAEVVSLTAEPELSEDNASDCDSGCFQSLEWAPLEEGSEEFKFYRAGVGMVLETKPDDPEDRVELVEFIDGADS